MIDAISLTQELVRIPSVNPPGDEERCARYLAGLLADAGFSVELDVFGPQRFNLVAMLDGKGRAKPLGFTGHLDTVPLGAARWERDPFGAEIVDGKLYGRGSSDMKAGIAAFIVSCLQARDAIREGNGLRLLLTGGEETGCDGARALAASGKGAQALSLLIVGEPTANYPCIGHKGALWLEGVALGKTAHGSMPEKGDNAIYKATRAIETLREIRLEDQHPLMGRATLNIGTFHAGLNINSVPDRATFTVDMRTVPGMVHECLCGKLRNLLGNGITLEPLVDVPPLHSEAGNPAIAAVFDVCAKYHDAPLVPRSVPFFTDGSTLGPLTGNPPTVILGPGEPAMAHQTDEYCHTARIEEAVTIYRSIIEAHC